MMNISSQHSEDKYWLKIDEYLKVHNKNLFDVCTTSTYHQ